jgi:hypothetical protein
MSMEESRGRSFERGARTSRWNEPGEAKQFIPGIPSFLSAMIPYPEMEALLSALDVQFSLRINELLQEFLLENPRYSYA